MRRFVISLIFAATTVACASGSPDNASSTPVTEEAGPPGIASADATGGPAVEPAEALTDTGPERPTPTAFVVPTTPTLGLRCETSDPTQSQVVGVDEWARVRAMPGLSGDELTRLPVRASVTAWPDELMYVDDLWWVPISFRDSTGEATCGVMAAQFVADEFGTVDGGLQAIGFELPNGWVLRRATRGNATFAPEPDPSIALQTSADLRIESGPSLAARAEDIRTAWDAIDDPASLGFSRPTEVLEPIEVPGADSAAIPRWPPSESGDGAHGIVWAQVGDMVMVADAYLYIEDLELGTEWFERFLESISIDRDRLAAAFAPAEESSG